MCNEKFHSYLYRMKLHYRLTGEGKSIILLHGLFGSSDNWQSFARSLSGKGYTVITPDLRNHGLSPHSGNFTIKEMANDLYELMNDLRLTSAVILGHSLGGKTAMQFAFEYPQLVDGLIVVDISPRKYEVQHHNVINALKLVDTASLKSRAEAEAILFSQLKDQGVVQWLMKSLYRKEKNSFDWRFNLEVISQQIENTAEEITTSEPFKKPVLFVKGEKSDYITTTDETLIHQLFENVEIKTAPLAGHWVQAENPAWLLTETTEFLLKLSN
jgi:esterase